MADPTVTGTVHLIEETKTYGQKGFRKRLVVVEQDKGRFTNYLPLEFVQDACESVDDMKVGDEVEIWYRLTGRKWQRDEQSEVKFFLSAEATRFVVKGGSGNDSSSESTSTSSDEINDEEVPF